MSRLFTIIRILTCTLYIAGLACVLADAMRDSFEADLIGSAMKTLPTFCVGLAAGIWLIWVVNNRSFTFSLAVCSTSAIVALCLGASLFGFFAFIRQTSGHPPFHLCHFFMGMAVGAVMPNSRTALRQKEKDSNKVLDATSL